MWLFRWFLFVALFMTMMHHIDATSSVDRSTIFTYVAKMTESWNRYDRVARAHHNAKVQLQISIMTHRYEDAPNTEDGDPMTIIQRMVFKRPLYEDVQAAKRNVETTLLALGDAQAQYDNEIVEHGKKMNRDLLEIATLVYGDDDDEANDSQ